MSTQMTTVIDGITYAWATCSGCSMHFTICECRGGPKEPKVFARWKAEAAGEGATSVVVKSPSVNVVSDQESLSSSGGSSTSADVRDMVTCKVGPHRVARDAADPNDDDTWTCHIHQSMAAVRG